MTELKQLFEDQKGFFSAGSTGMPDARLAALYCLNDTMENSRPMLETMLRADGLSSENVTAEINTVLAEQARWQKDLLRLLRGGWKKEQGGKPAPCGVILIFGAPGASFALTMSALFAAVAAGNTVVLSLEKMTPAAADCIRTMVAETFEPEYITVCNEASAELTEFSFDKTFDAGAATVETLAGRDGLRLFSRFTE